jgi:hypothetical protein
LEPNSELIAPPPIEERAKPDLLEQPEINEEVSVLQSSPAPSRWDGAGREIISATRSWIQYGTVAFAVLCIVIGAVEALFGR